MLVGCGGQGLEGVPFNTVLDTVQRTPRPLTLSLRLWEPQEPGEGASLMRVSSRHRRGVEKFRTWAAGGAAAGDFQSPEVRRLPVRRGAGVAT